MGCGGKAVRARSVFMLSVPRRNAVAFAIASFVVLNFAGLPSPAQNPVAVTAARSIASSDSDTLVDPVEKELLDLGHFGEGIQNVRAEILGLLSEESSCSAWFRAAEPEAAAKFRSLRYVVDSAGPGEILKIQDGADGAVAMQPYVARTGQNVGQGSTITLNAHGAFFQELARVRTRNSPNDFTLDNKYRSLVVGNFPGGSPAARLLTLLHEFGHIIDID